VRVVAQVAAGLSCRKTAERFKVSAASTIPWTQLQALIDGVSPRKRGGKSRSPLEPHAAWLLALVAKETDLTMEAFKARIADGLGVETSLRSIQRFFARHKITFKKTLHAAEQARPGVTEARERWKAAKGSLDPKAQVFIDKTGTNTKMVRAYGRCLKGRRLIGKQPFGHWKITTFTAALRCVGITAPWVLDGPMNRNAFLVYVEKVLGPTLVEGDIVIMDNLPAHKGEPVRRRIEATGTKLLFLPPIRPT